MSGRREHDSDDGEEGGEDLLTGILFGNIGENGRVDVDYLDEVREARCDRMRPIFARCSS